MTLTFTVIELILKSFYDSYECKQSTWYSCTAKELHRMAHFYLLIKIISV